MDTGADGARLVCRFGGELYEIDYVLADEARPAPWVGLPLGGSTLWIKCDGSPELISTRVLAWDRTAAVWRWQGQELVGEYWLAPRGAVGPYTVPYGRFALVTGFAPRHVVGVDSLQPGQLAGFGGLAKQAT